jgi:hypothetical protein
MKKQEMDLNEFMKSIVDFECFDPPSPISFEGSPTFSLSATPEELNLFSPNEPFMFPNSQSILETPISQPTTPDSISVEQLFHGTEEMVQETIQQWKDHPEELTASQKKAIRESKRNLVCNNCKTQKTCLWRKSLDKKHHLCNPCSLYERQHKKPRPIDYKNRPARKTRENPLCKKSGYVTLHWSQLQSLLDMAGQCRFRRS